MLRLPLALAFMIIGFAAPAASQDTANEAWAWFHDTCTRVTSDPNAYLQSLRRPGPQGERVLSVSPDQKAVVVLNYRQNSYERVRLYLVGQRQFRECSLIVELFDADTGSFANQLLAHLRQSPGLTVAGGMAPLDYVGEGSVYAVRDAQTFAVGGAFADQNLLATIHIEPGLAKFHVYQTLGD